MNYSIFDIESNGLLYKGPGKPQADRIWCMSVYQVRDGVSSSFSITDYDEMIWFLTQGDVLIGHNIARFDIPMLEKFLGIDLSSIKFIDTLALSWYLYPELNEHGLEAWGEILGIAKPKVEDWQEGSIEEYLIRCQEDVKINTALWNMMSEYLIKIYETWDKAWRFTQYLSFKMSCAREQEEQMWKLDVEKCETGLAKLKEIYEEKKAALAAVMPKVPVYKVKERPKKPFKKDGSLSKIGQEWLDFLKEQGLPEYHISPVKYKVSEEEPNPGSHQQLKDWLFSLGWKPSWYKPSKSKTTGEIKQVPQITNRDKDDIDFSVKDLYEIAPELQELEGFYVVKHRIGILEGFLENRDENNYLKAQIKGLTNTLRFQHTTLVNLPQIPKPYWEEVRGCLIADDGMILCGSDMSSLEDNTKQHYMMYFDPEYVRIMRTPGFDPHIYMAVNAKACSWYEAEFYKWSSHKKEGKEYNYLEPPVGVNPTDNSCLEGESKGLPFSVLISLPEEAQAKIMKILKPIRIKNKKVNFAAVYGASASKLAETASIPLSEGKALHTTYWIINRSVKQIAQSCIVKIVGKQMWLFNPVSRFWLSLREEKDRFSTLNQSTGVYAFDTWLKYVRSHGIKLKGQFHDEKISGLFPHQKEEHEAKLRKSIDLTNAELRLNVPLAISVDFGFSYAEIH